MKRCIFLIGFFYFILMNCSSPNKEIQTRIVGPTTQAVVIEKYVGAYYVSTQTGSDERGDGSIKSPWRSMDFALRQIKDATAQRRYALCVAAGEYSVGTIQMNPFIDLYGGFDPQTWQRDVLRQHTILRPAKGGRLFVGADEALLDGFVVHKGMVRDKGAALYCDGTSPIIRNNVFLANKTLTPLPWQPRYLHQTANDGGAIYARNGASPIIENNIFAFNETECGRGAAIALHGRCGGRIARNVFFQNRAGLSDPMRSSDGGAVSVFEWSHPVIADNVFLHNEAKANNDAGALFVALWSAPAIKRNLFIGNRSDDDAGALFVGGQEHRYDRPLDPIPAADIFFVAIDSNLFFGNANPSKNSGAMRFTMDSRGRFAHNLVVFNSGIYFQRCEAVIEDNIIMDHFLMIESKSELKPSTIRSNLIWGEFTLQTQATVQDNTLRQKLPGNTSTPPIFHDDRIECHVLSSAFNAKQATTELLISSNTPNSNEWVHRIVKAGDRWGVIRGHEGNHLQIWGDLSGCLQITILPTYSKKK